MPQYQWLFFDADGTLFDYNRAESAALEQAFQQIGLSCAQHVLTAYRRINHEVWQALEQGLITPATLKIKRFELLFKETAIVYPADEFSAIYLDCLADCSQLIDGAGDMLDALRRKYRMAILTNGLQKVQRSRLARSMIRDHFSEIIISEEIGAAKPSKEFFEVAFARTGNPHRREVLMIGDNWSSDIQGAADFSVDTCWYNPRRQSRPSHLSITREIASLHELVDWLQ